MALFGKKKEDAPPAGGMPPDMGMPPPDQGYGDQGYPQDPGQYPQDAYPQDPGQYPQDQYPPGTPTDQQGPMPPPEMGMSRERIEEIAEAIVEEKWTEKKKDIDKIVEWKDETATVLAQLKQQITDLRASFDSLHKGMLGKISEYDENLTNVGTDIKAMEKVFSKVLPSLTDSVNKLQRISGGPKKRI